MNPTPTTTDSKPLELHLLLLDETERQSGHWTKIGIASAILHVLALTGLSVMPQSWWKPGAAPPEAVVKHVTPLIAPRFDLTQKERNRAEVTRQIDLDSLMAHTRAPHVTPPSAPAPAKTKAFASPPPAPAPAPRPQPAAERAALAPPPGIATANPALPPAPPPQIQAEAPPPKLAFENPTAGQSPAGKGVGISRIAPPRNSVDEAMRAAMQGGSHGGGMTVGDAEEATYLPSPRSTGMAKPASSVELLSDPQGTDFKPYLIRVLAAVRRNWLAVIPESARFGGVRGRVLVQFAINRDGTVRKIVFAGNSGSEALDRAAIAGVSASSPFPPLPNEFAGPEIRLQLSFTYNQR